MRTIEYFYSAHSVFAYLGSATLKRIADQTGARIEHRPMDLHFVMQEVGVSAFKSRNKAHIDYFFGTEIERWSKARGAPWLGRIPTHHARDYALANRCLIAVARSGQDVDRLSHAFLQAHWRDDANLSDAATLKELADGLGLPGADILNRAGGEAVERAYLRNSEEAIERSVFGSPTYFVDQEMFYGQDRLDFVEAALQASD